MIQTIALRAIVGVYPYSCPRAVHDVVINLTDHETAPKKAGQGQFHSCHRGPGNPFTPFCASGSSCTRGLNPFTKPNFYLGLGQMACPAPPGFSETAIGAVEGPLGNKC